MQQQIVQSNEMVLAIIYRGIRIELRRIRTPVRLVGADSFMEDQELSIDGVNIRGLKKLEILDNGWGNRTLEANADLVKAWIDRKLAVAA